MLQAGFDPEHTSFHDEHLVVTAMAAAAFESRTDVMAVLMEAGATWLLLRRTLPHRSSQQPLQLWPVLPASELVSRAAELVEEISLVLRLEGGGSAWLIVYVWCDMFAVGLSSWKTTANFLETTAHNFVKMHEKIPGTIDDAHLRRDELETQDD